MNKERLVDVGNPKSKSKLMSGFTLIEILMVIAIIGILSSVVLASLRDAKDSAQIAKVEGTLDQLRRAIELLESDSFEWPGHAVVGTIDVGGAGNEVWDLNSQDAGLVQTDGTFLNWNGPYIPNVPTDPWGNHYFFDTDYDIDPPNGQWAVVIGSFGPNGVGQNVYDSDNIIEIIISE